MKSYSNLKKQLLKNKAINKAYDDIGPEFALIEAIIETRIKKGLSQEQLAKKIGSRQPVISRLEQGTYNPSLKFLHRVASALDVKLKVSIG